MKTTTVMTAFFNMKEILGEKAEEYGDAVLENGVYLKAGNILEKEQMTAYEEIYVAIPVNSQNPETAVKFVEYLLQ